MKDIFICDCESLDHTFRFYWDEESKLLYFYPRLNNYKNLLKRLKRAIGYVFGIGKRKGKIYHFGDYDEVIIRPEDASLLIKYLKKYDSN